MRARPLLAMLGLVSLLGVARSAAAAGEPLPLDLTWDAPEGCPDASVVLRRIEQILLAPPPPTTVVAKARVRATEDHRFVLTLTLRNGDVEETRTVDAASCSALADASAVVIALAIDPTQQPAPPPDDVGPVPPPPPRAAALPPRPPPPPPKAPLRISAGLGVVIEPSTLPKVGGGLDLSAGLRLDRLRLAVHGALWLRQHAVFDASTGAGASFGMVQAGVLGGYLFPVRSFAFGPSAGLDADFVRVEGFGIRDPRTTWTSWPTVVLGGRAEAQLGRFLSLFARAEAVLPIDAPTFTLGTSGSGVALHEPAPLAPRFTLGTEISLP